ncbi:DUF7668 domain-containing protein [Pectobacterium jejuense]|uniref:DUF7668 domain-containing protein n=1 Tax=Pectobacterium jejuense TaxID=2974022 RepID=UPI00227DDF19|nr:hypothetical protein [Pectobacterium jejuense]MCY9849210.1 hypothetical protein [Pectobacterium jejuense]
MRAKHINDAVKNLVSLLVKAEFDLLDEYGMLGPSTKVEYADALKNYLGQDNQLVMPPDAYFDRLDIYETKQQDKVRVDFDLWDTSGFCDLTAKISVSTLPDNTYFAVLYDLRVL